jgi:hypothetical protein
VECIWTHHSKESETEPISKAHSKASLAESKKAGRFVSEFFRFTEPLGIIMDKLIRGAVIGGEDESNE